MHYGNSGDSSVKTIKKLYTSKSQGYRLFMDIDVVYITTYIIEREWTIV
jgi:hypothetical protein